MGHDCILQCVGVRVGKGNLVLLDTSFSLFRCRLVFWEYGETVGWFIGLGDDVYLLSFFFCCSLILGFVQKREEGRGDVRNYCHIYREQRHRIN